MRLQLIFGEGQIDCRLEHTGHGYTGDGWYFYLAARPGWQTNPVTQLTRSCNWKQPAHAARSKKPAQAEQKRPESRRTSVAQNITFIHSVKYTVSQKTVPVLFLNNSDPKSRVLHEADTDSHFTCWIISHILKRTSPPPPWRMDIIKHSMLFRGVALWQLVVVML